MIIYLCPFTQISSKYNSSLFSSFFSTVPTTTGDFPFLAAIPSPPAPHSHGFSEFVTQAQTHSVSSDILCLTSTWQYLIFSFLFPSLWPLSTPSRLFLWLYLGLSNSLNAFLKDPPNFTPHLSELPASFLPLSTPPALQQISECCYWGENSTHPNNLQSSLSPSSLSKCL